MKIGFFRTDSDLLYQGSQRLERLPVPESALRETVINASENFGRNPSTVDSLPQRNRTTVEGDARSRLHPPQPLKLVP